MKGRKLKVALVFGGRSAEHEVSRRSALSVFEALDKTLFEPVPVLITQEGGWFIRPATAESFTDTSAPAETDRAVFSPDPTHKGFLRICAQCAFEPFPVDVVFPVLHGTYGEDGAIQGLFEMADVAYVGCGVASSALGMDKVLMKAVFRDQGLEVTPFFWFLRSHWPSARASIHERLKASRFPVFVKPANLGSSVGISRVETVDQFEPAVERAMRYDRKILVEDGVVGRELEVSVLGSDDPQASVAGEIVTRTGFYDYEEKYLAAGAKLIIPAELTEEQSLKAKEKALIAFKAVDGAGLARVDLFLTPDDRFIINEINTMPGFTSISMYPKLWEASGLPYDRLIVKLIELALERREEKRVTVTVRDRN
jgi:D-alanine-D-alanine ligase